MTSTRRQFAWMFGAVCGGLALSEASGALAQDDDTPANVFISPCGKPFRAPPGAPYPVVDWFKQADKNGDGKIDHAEFLADAAAFFAVLDLNHDGVLENFEVMMYERQVAPEILGYRVKVGAAKPAWGSPAEHDGARLWLAQMDRPGPIDPGGDTGALDTTPTPHTIDESQQGASPYSFFDEPEPVAAADIQFRGIISKNDFLKLADIHFTSLDHDNEGFLTLAKLPKTPVQKALLKRRHKRS